MNPMPIAPPATALSSVFVRENIRIAPLKASVMLALVKSLVKGTTAVLDTSTLTMAI
jgi:hypothetical protein